MAAIVQELFAGRTETLGDKPKAEISYVVLDAASEIDVRAAALSAIPVFHLGLLRRSITLDERINATTWKVVATFEAPEPQEQDRPEPVVSFDTAGGTQHITQSRRSVGRFGPSASAALGGAIGFDGQNVAGVDITVPVFNLAETHFIPDAVVTAGYQGVLFALTGAVNSAFFRGFQPGECLFLGASGSKRGAERWEITYKFAGQPNRLDLQVGDIGPISKRGWDYLWVQYGDDVDATVKTLIKRPIAVYVEEVYPSAGFAALGIGS